MKKNFSNRKNRIIGLIIALEITACSFTSAGIYNISSERYLEGQTQLNNSIIAMTLASAAGTHKVMLDASQVQAIDSKRWKGPVLTKSRGTITGPSGVMHTSHPMKPTWGTTIAAFVHISSTLSHMGKTNPLNTAPVMGCFS